MDFTIIENPYKVGGNLLLDSYKVAKLNNSTKRPTLLANWLKALPKKVETERPAMNIAADSEKNFYSNMVCVDYYSHVENFSGARKLKVKPVVVNKTRNYFQTNGGSKIDNEPIILKEEPPKVEYKAPEPVPPVQSVSRVEMSQGRVDNELHMSRVERTGEIPVVTRSDLYAEKEVKEPNVINTPARFMDKEQPSKPATPEVQDFSRTYDALINDKEPQQEVREAKVAEPTTGGDPNLYNKLIHGEDGGNVLSDLKEARAKLTSAQEEQEKARRVNANLEAEVAKVRETVENLRRQQSEAQKRELDNTLNMLQETKEEILGETRKYDNLKMELAELIRQRDTLLAGNNYHDAYSEPDNQMETRSFRRSA